MVLSAAENAAESMSLITILGKAKIGEAEVVRPARTATMVWGGQFNQVTPRTRLTRNLAIAVSGGETAPFFVDAGQNVVLEMCKAGKVQVPLKLVRRGDFKSNVVLAPSSLAAERAAGQHHARRQDGRRQSGDHSAGQRAGRARTRSRVLGTTQVNYSRNPEAVKEATDRKAAVDKIVAELAAAAKAATDAKAAAEKKAAD